VNRKATAPSRAAIAPSPAVQTPDESDSDAWSRVRDSVNPADFEEFIRKYPDSAFVRQARFRIDLFERIRRENEEAKKAAERVKPK
jgi:hypothetical protein